MLQITRLTSFIKTSYISVTAIKRLHDTLVILKLSKTELIEILVVTLY